MKTYNDIYLQARNALREHGLEGYSLEARLLVATAAPQPKATQYTGPFAKGSSRASRQ